MGAGAGGVPSWNRYHELKSQYNRPDNSMSHQEFVARRDKLINSINMSRSAKTFAYDQVGEKSKITAQAMIEEEEGDCLSRIHLTGSDTWGSWEARGYIMARNGGLFLWLYKEYDNKVAAGQTDGYENLVWESYYYNDMEGMKGKWFYLGHEHEPTFNGEWRIFTQPQDGLTGKQNYYGQAGGNYNMAPNQYIQPRNTNYSNTGQATPFTY